MEERCQKLEMIGIVMATVSGFGWFGMDERREDGERRQGQRDGSVWIQMRSGNDGWTLGWFRKK